MDAGLSDNVAEELFSLFNYMRGTFEGILACNSPNVWNVFGGLNRAKNATFNILTHELRIPGNEQVGKDQLKTLCLKLLENFPCEGELDTDDENVEDYLLTWIEQYLLDHGLFTCLKSIFLDEKHLDIKSLYKEFSFLKNTMLLNAFLICLDAVQQHSMDELVLISPLLMNKSTFMTEILPWVSQKVTEEYNIMNEPAASPAPWSSTLQAPKLDPRCEICDQLFILSNDDQAICNACSDNMSESNRSRSNTRQSSFGKDILIKSALTAVLENKVENTSWYNEDGNSETLQNLQHKLTHMKELSRSESSLFQEHGHIDNKVVHSDQDVLDSEDIDHEDIKNDEQSETVSVVSMTLPRSSSTVTKKRGHHRSKSDQIGMMHFSTPGDDVDGCKEMSPLAATSLPKETATMGQYSGVSNYYHDEGQLFPKPYKGQSLISYLDSRSYDTGAQLDKENAHFSICEALITAIEQMRCQNITSDLEDSEEEEEVDEEIRNLRQEIKAREKFIRQRKSLALTSAFSDSGKSSTTYTSTSQASSNNTTEDTQGVDSPVHRQLTISASWENVSLASSNTLSPDMTTTTKKNNKEIDIDKVEIIRTEEIPPDDFSAEAVAKSLLKKFEGRSIPAASELKWMVTEEEVPQQLLPLPTAWPVSPDDNHDENSDLNVTQAFRQVTMPSLLRGNMEWAPPRPQIIFNTHPFVKRKVMLQRQHFRCSGCGLKVTPNLSKRFRYCEYVGKYFCTSCHQNKLALIPSKILSKWDFKKYPVSDFAKELLKKIYRDPLFNIADVSPGLYENVRNLAVTKKLRFQLHYIKNFLRTCRLAESNQKDVSRLPMHIADDPHSYSIDDLVQVKSSELIATLKTIVGNAVKHVKEECPEKSTSQDVDVKNQLCQAKGFICEFCRAGNDILYPFELTKVQICPDCKTCYHRACYVPDKCARCSRIKARHDLLQKNLPDSPEPVS